MKQGKVTKKRVVGRSQFSSTSFLIPQASENKGDVHDGLWLDGSLPNLARLNTLEKRWHCHINFIPGFLGWWVERRISGSKDTCGQLFWAPEIKNCGIQPCKKNNSDPGNLGSNPTATNFLCHCEQVIYLLICFSLTSQLMVGNLVILIFHFLQHSNIFNKPC